jgi:hypothetical protein
VYPGCRKAGCRAATHCRDQSVHGTLKRPTVGETMFDARRRRSGPRG